MKTQTPLVRHQSLVSFSKDHHFGLLLVWKIRQGLANAISPERISNYVLFFFNEDLRQHFSDEEKLLFCKLDSEDVLRKQAETDHETIYHLIEDIRQNMSDTQLLNKLAVILEKHIRFEEREFFQHLQHKIAAEVLAGIAARFSTDSRDIDARWADKFWEMKNRVEDGIAFNQGAFGI